MRKQSITVKKTKSLHGVQIETAALTGAAPALLPALPPDGVEVPTGLTPACDHEVKRLVAELEAKGLLPLISPAHLDLYAQAWEQLQSASVAIRQFGVLAPSFDTHGVQIGHKKSPAVSAANEARASLRTLLKDMGLTPSGSGYQTPKEDDDEFDEFEAGKS